MAHVYLYGELVQVPDEDLLSLIGLELEGILSLAEAMHRSHISGFPDIEGNQWKKVADDYVRQLHQVYPQVKDGELKGLLGILTEHVQKLSETDTGLLRLVAKSVDSTLPRTANERIRFTRRVDNRLKENVGSFWRSRYPEEFKALLDVSKRLSQQITETVQIALLRISEISE
jgi:hypothetical protein